MNVDGVKMLVSPIVLGGLGVHLFLLSVPSLCRLWDRWRSSNGVLQEGRIHAVRMEPYVGGDEQPTKARYDFSYSYIVNGVVHWGQDTWLERDHALLWGRPPEIDAAVDVKYNFSHPQRSVAYPFGTSTQPEFPPDNSRFISPTGERGMALLGFFGFLLIWVPFSQPGAALLVAVLLAPTLAVVVARCLCRDRDRSFAILWYTGIVGLVEVLLMDAAVRGRSVGMALTGLLAVLAILFALVWYLRTMRRDVLHIPILSNDATVSWLHRGIGRHVWMAWRGIEAEVKVKPRILSFGSSTLRGMVRVHHAITPGPHDAPRAQVVLAADLQRADCVWLRSLPHLGELFRRFPEALVVVRWEALYVTISSGLRSATDAMTVAQLARDILCEFSNAPRVVQGYRDGSSVVERRSDDLMAKIVEKTPKRWDKL